MPPPWTAHLAAVVVARRQVAADRSAGTAARRRQRPDHRAGPRRRDRQAPAAYGPNEPGMLPRFLAGRLAGLLLVSARRRPQQHQRNLDRPGRRRQGNVRDRQARPLSAPLRLGAGRQVAAGRRPRRHAASPSGCSLWAGRPAVWTWAASVRPGSIGWTPAWAARERSSSPAASRTGRPSCTYLDSPISRPRRLTDFNAEVAGRSLGKVETIAWKVEDGSRPTASSPIRRTSRRARSILWCC